MADSNTGDSRSVRAIPVDEIARRLAAYRVRIDRLRKALDRAIARHDALETVLLEFDVVMDRSEKPNPVPQGDVEAIRGKALRQALIILAERHDGILQSGAARRALAAAGAPMEPNRLWREIQLVRRFKKLNRGTYKLVAAEQESGALPFGSGVDT